MQRFTISVMVLVSLLLCLAVSVCAAQEQTSDIPKRVEERMQVLNKALSLTDDQKSKVKTILTKYMEEEAKAREQSPETREERRAASQAARERLIARDEAIEAVLTPAQVEKYHALLLKESVDARIASLDEALELTDDQMVKLRTILEGDTREMEKLRNEMSESGGDRSTIMGKLREQRQKTNEAIEALLTAEQVEKFRAMDQRMRQRR